MAARRPIAKDRFGGLLSSAKTQAYQEAPSRGPGTNTIRTIAWNATGSLIATGSVNKTIRIWNPERPNVRHSTELKGHTAGIERVLFNPVKEAEVASCSADGTVKFWDARSKQCTNTLTVGGEPFTLAWSDDGSVLLCGRKVSTISGINWCNQSVDFPQDDALIPISFVEDTPNALPTQQQNIQTNSTTFSHASPPRDLFVTLGDGTVKIFDYPSFQPLHTLHAHTSSCISIALSPSARYLAIGGSDALISLWDTTDWICRRTLSSTATSAGGVKSVSWSWDGRYLCGANYEPSSDGEKAGGIDVWHAETGENVHTVPTGGMAVQAVAWHPNRYWLAYSVPDGPVSGSGGLRIVGAAGGQL